MKLSYKQKQRLDNAVFISIMLVVVIALISCSFFGVRSCNRADKKDREDAAALNQVYHKKIISSLRYVHNKNLNVCYAVHVNGKYCFREKCGDTMITSVECTPGVLKIADEIE